MNIQSTLQAVDNERVIDESKILLPIIQHKRCNFQHFDFKSFYKIFSISFSYCNITSY